MPLRSLFALSALALSLTATLWGGALPALPGPDDAETPIAAAIPAEDAGLLQSAKPAVSATAVPAESQRLTTRIRAGLAEHGEYAPLALFSLGSLAVGGAFYAINVSSRKPNVTQTAGGRSSLTNAVGVAGLTALLAAGSYFYFSGRDSALDSDWDAQVSGGVAPDGGMSVGALLTFPLPSLAR
jgi:hypothetical protein